MSTNISSTKENESFYITRVIPLSRNFFYLPLRSEISQDELDRLQMLLFPQSGLTLEEWNDRFCQIEEIFS